MVHGTFARDYVVFAADQYALSVHDATVARRERREQPDRRERLTQVSRYMPRSTGDQARAALRPRGAGAGRTPGRGRVGTRRTDAVSRGPGQPV